jgi:D-xylose transport system ATP-binding protein
VREITRNLRQSSQVECFLTELKEDEAIMESASPTLEANPILEVKGVTKSFGAVDVLQGIDFSVLPGSVTALVGDNGAGKSTLIKGLAGIQPFDGGTIYFEGKEVKLDDPRAAAELGIEVVYQDLALCDNLDIVQNMFLGRELKRGLALDEAHMEARAGETLQSLSVRTVSSLRQKVSSLSGGQRQTVAIARSVLWNNKVVILDEPTAALGVAQTEQVLALVRRLADAGLGVVIISHNLQDIFQVADYVYVLYLGTMVTRLRVDETTSGEIVEYITGGKTDLVAQNGAI